MTRATGWVALALVTGLATACGGDATLGPDPTVTAVDTPSEGGSAAAATPTEPEVGVGDAMPIPDVSGPIAAGRYHTTVMRPPFELELGDGWSATGENEQAVRFFHGQDADTVIVAIARPQRVIDPNATLDGNGVLPDEARLPLPADLVAWFQEHPLLETGAPTAVMIGGAVGARFDLTVGEVTQPTCGPGCAVLLATEEIDFTVKEGMVIRSYILDVGGDILAIGVLVPEPATAEAGFALGDAVVESLEFSDA